MSTDIYHSISYGIDLGIGNDIIQDRIRGFYGEDVAQELFDGYGVEDSFIKFVLDRAGFVTRDANYLHGLEDEFRDMYYRSRQNTLSEIGVEIVTYGTYESLGIILCARGSSTAAGETWSPGSFDPSHFKPKQSWDVRIRNFCQELGISILEDPKWIFSSYYSY